MVISSTDRRPSLSVSMASKSRCSALRYSWSAIRPLRSSALSSPGLALPSSATVRYPSLFASRKKKASITAWWNSSRSSLPSPFLSCSCTHVFASGAAGVWAHARPAGARPPRMPRSATDIDQPCLTRLLSPSTLHLPGTVGLSTRGAVRLVRLAVDGHVALELAAIGAAGLIGPHRRHRSGMAVVGIGPRHGLAGGRRLERFLLRLGGKTLVALVERIAREPAEQRTADDRARDGRAATARRRRDQAAKGRAAERADGCLRIVLDGRASRRADNEEHDDGGHLQHRSRHPVSFGQRLEPRGAARIVAHPCPTCLLDGHAAHARIERIAQS